MRDGLGSVQSVLVLGGPQKPVSAEEQLLLADYVRTGGRFMVLLDPGSRAGLDNTLEAWGLQADKRTVLDTQTILGGDLTMPVVNTYGSHEITQDSCLVSRHWCSSDGHGSMLTKWIRRWFSSLLATAATAWCTMALISAMMACTWAYLGR